MTELHRLGGAASLRQLKAAGATERVLGAGVMGGTLIRPRNGRYALPSLGEPAATALRSGGRLSCVTAAATYGLWGGDDRRIHLAFPPNAGRAGSADPTQVRHWARCDDNAEIWRVSVADCLRTVVRCSQEETAVAVLDTALSSGLLSRNGLRRMFEEEPIRARKVIERVRPGSDSGVESVLRQRLTAAGHLVEQQIAVAGVGRVDARVDGVLLIEVDGFAFHGGRDAFERDRRRDVGMAVHGLRWMRVSARQVIHDPDSVVTEIERALCAIEGEAYRA